MNNFAIYSGAGFFGVQETIVNLDRVSYIEKINYAKDSCAIYLHIADKEGPIEISNDVYEAIKKKIKEKE